MYETMRDELILELSDKFSQDQINQFLSCVDNVTTHYIISKKEHSMVRRSLGIPNMLRDYLACKRIEGLSPATLDGYARLLAHFFVSIGKSPSEITPNEIRIYLWRYQSTRGVSNRTLDKYREYIARFYAWAFEEGYVSQNPTKTVRPIHYEEIPRRALKQCELDQLRSACQDLRDHAIIEFLYSTGCRVSELVVIKMCDIDWELQRVKLFGKGRKHRVSFLNDRATAALNAYLKVRQGGGEYVFVSKYKPHTPLQKEGIEKIVRDISERAGYNTPVTPHILRHTMATLALQAGMPITDISRILGHESLETTRIYTESDLETIQENHRKYIV